MPSLSALATLLGIIKYCLSWLGCKLKSKDYIRLASLWIFQFPALSARL
jgi:hypothetical protein